MSNKVVSIDEYRGRREAEKELEEEIEVHDSIYPGMDPDSIRAFTSRLCNICGVSCKEGPCIALFALIELLCIADLDLVLEHIGKLRKSFTDIEYENW